MALLRQLYIQVLIAIALATLLGIVAPATAIDMKPLGDAFIALLRMMLGPIIFCSVVLGLAPERVLWGTDWPHVNLHGPMPDDGVLTDLIAEIAPDDSARHRMLVLNPQHLFGFPADR